MRVGGLVLRVYLPDREARLIGREYCRFEPHSLQVIPELTLTSSRAKHYLEGRAGHIGAHFRD